MYLRFSLFMDIFGPLHDFDQIQGKPMDLTIFLKILKNMHFQNREIKLSRVVWSVSLLRPHSGRHTETAIINNYFVFQDLEFPFFSIFFKLLSNPSKSIEIVENCTSEVGKHRNNGDISYPRMLFLKTSLKSNQSNFQLHWSKRKVVSSIQT